MQNRIIFISILFIGFVCKAKDIPSSAYDNEIQLYRQQAMSTLSTQQGPLSPDTAKGLQYFVPNEAFKVIASYQKIKADSITVIPTYSGKQNDYIEYAKLSFNLGGQDQELTAFKGIKSMQMPQYKNKIFIMFKDETNGITTYGGGRYIYIEESLVEDNTLAIDFNKAFNPNCAYSDGYNCPIPPPENHLNVEINAGEKSFSKI